MFLAQSAASTSWRRFAFPLRMDCHVLDDKSNRWPIAIAAAIPSQ